MEHSVGRDYHKMTAFVRFREFISPDPPGDLKHYLAWYEPDHLILRLVSPFFVNRFSAMRFSIFTPDGCLIWDLERLSFGAGVPRREAFPESGTVDPLENLWKTYYSSIFNPARIKLNALNKELPVRYRKNLPEAALIGPLLRAAPARLQQFHDAHQAKRPEAAHWMPPPHKRTRETLSQAARSCAACGLCEQATQSVFGEGPSDASLMLVGEQPGDEEDRIGRPFVGPAGKLLDQILELSEIRRPEVYVTNAVKHFKWERRGKMRLHQRPNAGEIAACRPWLGAELALVRPKLVVALGATAAQSLLGKVISIEQFRGRASMGPQGVPVWVTTHPSAILRMPDPQVRERGFARMVEDLRAAQGLPLPGALG